MKSLSTYYSDKDSLHSFISENRIENSSSLLIQVFSANTSKTFISGLLEDLTSLLPDAVIIGTTTDGEILDGKVSSGKVVLNFTQFEHTTLQCAGIGHTKEDGYDSGRFLAKELVNDDTKLLIAFVDGLYTNGEMFLDGISSVSQDMKVAGGYAGDNSNFEETFVFTKEGIYAMGAVAVSLDSQHLHIHTDYSFNWHPIGNELTITKAEGNRVYEINGRSAVETYAYYLGEELAEGLPAVGVEFPLIVNRNGENVARASIGKESDGSLIVGGNLYTGEKVRIGFGSSKDILSRSQKMVETVSKKPSEAIFVYSCMTRKHFMGSEVQKEVLPLQDIAPVSGFYTYGEFFTANKKELFNQTMTLVSLSESDTVHDITPDINEKKVDIAGSSINALIHLINLTSQEAKERTKQLNQSNELSQTLKERLELALSGSNEGVWDWNVEQNSVYFSPRWKEMIGYQDDELRDTFECWEKRIHPDDLEATWRDVHKNFYKETEYYENVHRLKHKDGHWVWILARGKTLFDEDGKPVRMIGTHTDITEQKMLQLKSLEQSQVIEQIHDGVIRTDMEGIVLSWNPGAEKIYGYKAEEVIGKHISIIYRPQDSMLFKEIKRVVVEEGEYCADLYFITKSNESISIALSLTILKDENGIPIGIIGINRDITERKQAQELLEKQKDILHYQAHYDTLTGLPNRMLFMDRLDQAIIKAKRNDNKVALVFIDVDKFKHINDSLGHLVGDKVLRIVAERLGSSIRRGDTLARLSGDEFTMIIEELSDAQHLVALAQKLLSLMREPMYIDDHELYLSLSIGVSIYPDDAMNAMELLKYADTAMYKAKEGGRNNFQFYSSEMTEHALERMMMKTSIKQAIEKDEFIVHYQPQMDVLSGKIVGLEALVRWQHPEMGLLLPGAFIPLAEETGMVVEIDRLVSEKVIKQVSGWYQEALFEGSVSLNLTIKQLEYQGFVDELKTIIEKYDFIPSNLELEISEAHVMKSTEYVAQKVEELNELGVRISIDDFGTGYSSLSLLKRLPIHQLKIDHTFIGDIPHDKDSIGIVEAIIVLAKSLKIDIIAEGVETSKQKVFLIGQDCIKMQGNYFSEPLPADEIVKLLKNNHTVTM